MSDHCHECRTRIAAFIRWNPHLDKHERATVTRQLEAACNWTPTPNLGRDLMPYPDGTRGGYVCPWCGYDTVARVLLDDHQKTCPWRPEGEK